MGILTNQNVALQGYDMNAAFIFPGQGSQFVGMMKEFYGNRVVMDTIEEASDTLRKDFSSLIFGDNEFELNQTTNTQPLILISSIAIWRLYREKNGPNPKIMAGHSLGEYSALTAAEALDFKQALKLIEFRANVMQKAVPTGIGTMAAVIGLSGEVVIEICKKVSSLISKVEPANFNSADQTVISGFCESVDEVCKIAKETGARRAIKLPVSAPFHSSLMSPASKELFIRLEQEKILPPKIPVVNNVDVDILTNNNQIKDSLARQAMSPVRWYEIIRKFSNSEIDLLIECGPGKVLAGLNKRICPSIQSYSLSNELIINKVVSKNL
ncbi:MAG: [acyl-carrier-protein] S-malonyltransferase [Betaproteobacteria bacterium TMED156]|nr:MAG: [acyl-carrier-protein] S-malonyltransferase [Betaproteobacteria bacterium TMED156]